MRTAGRAINALAMILVLSGCKRDRKDEEAQHQAGPKPAATGARASEEPPSAHELGTPAGDPKRGAGQEPTTGEQAAEEHARAKASAPTCPPGMNRVTGGQFLVGNLHKTYNEEENPRFQTRLPAFCAGIHEVSAREYESCVSAGECSPSHDRSKTCNSVAKGKGEHPINCIDHGQATAVCEFLGGRLPTEVEWEYLARGGTEMREYPWGDGPIDGNTCWKSHQSCPRGSFTEGAFGLHDVVGNVWEWTSSWFAPYPWPQTEGRHRVYRGGSWSRRFPKWMRATLRNRLDPEGYGSHLGVRCVADLPNESCPYGREADEEHCKFGVDRVDCLEGKEWNGVRCAPKGDSRRCPSGAEERPGEGCVRQRVAGAVERKLDTKSVVLTRSPEFDADCQANAPGRPHAYRLTGGGHLARNAVGKDRGCKNRDVGVGWNSACCP